MKSKWIKQCLFLALAAGMAGCTIENSTEIETRFFPVAQRDWKWNASYKRYERIVDFPELSQGIYEKGTVLGGVFILEQDANGEYEVLKSLPFVQSIPYQNRSYTRTISFDVAPGQVAFYIQSSDLADDPNDLGNFDFKITLVWEETRR
ncbi:MAG: hypothetical protein LBD64_04815 [Odoribacteraceae bacterium]|jgi:hypothetical protein|nr:hypothetical protein [Odoribacteraceae bacterium]